MAIEIISGSLAGSVAEDLVLSARGTVILENSADNVFLELKIDGVYGVFSIRPTGEWVYLLDNELKSVQALGSSAVVHDFFLVSSASLQSQARIDIAVQGSNDIASFSGDLQKSLSAKKEEKVSGRVLISDQDIGEKEIQKPGVFKGTNGNLEINIDGEWTYTLSGADRISILDKGKEITDNVSLSSRDGTNFNIEIKIIASNLLAINQIKGTGNTDYLPGTTVADLILGLGGDDTLIGGLGDDTLDGGTGIDTAVYSGTRASHKLTDGTDTLISIERLKYSDVNVALDLDGNAGTVAKILGAFLGAPGVKRADLVGVGLGFLDGGGTYEGLLQEAIAGVFGKNPSAETLINHFFQTLTGQAAPKTIVDSYAPLINNGSLTPIGLAGQVVAHELNLQNIGLVGLANTGIEYIV